jgi:hypothetical protein
MRKYIRFGWLGGAVLLGALAGCRNSGSTCSTACPTQTMAPPMAGQGYPHATSSPAGYPNSAYPSAGVPQGAAAMPGMTPGATPGMAPGAAGVPGGLPPISTNGPMPQSGVGGGF